MTVTSCAAITQTCAFGDGCGRSWQRGSLVVSIVPLNVSVPPVSCRHGLSGQWPTHVPPSLAASIAHGVDAKHRLSAPQLSPFGQSAEISHVVVHGSTEAGW